MKKTSYQDSHLDLLIRMAFEQLEEEDTEQLYSLKERLIRGALEIPDVTVNGRTGRDSAPHIVSLSVRGVRAEVLLHALEDKGVYVSSGSACSTNHPHPSDTLTAIGIDKDLITSTIRLSMSVMTTEEEIDAAVAALKEIIPFLRRYTRH